MPAAQSPRIDRQSRERMKLRSTHVIDGTTPRRVQSIYQAVATSRGYTIKAGAPTRARLSRGVPTYRATPKSDLTNTVGESTVDSDSNKANR